MSNYLTNFYCGNKKYLCNYNKPLKYEKLLDRQFNNNLHYFIEDCNNIKNSSLGYCCNKNGKDMDKPLDLDFMNQLNKSFDHEFFHPNNKIPLIKTYKNSKDELKVIDLCTCGGDENEYKECVEKNCNEYRPPTRYEYCKMGANINNNKYCVIPTREKVLTKHPDMENISNSVELTPGITGDEENEEEVPKECVLRSIKPRYDRRFTENVRINNLHPDCYLSLCSKFKPGNLDNLINSTTTDENKYHKLNSNNKKTNNKKTNNKKINNIKIDKEKSLFDYFNL